MQRNQISQSNFLSVGQFESAEKSELRSATPSAKIKPSPSYKETPKKVRKLKTIKMSQIKLRSRSK